MILLTLCVVVVAAGLGYFTYPHWKDWLQSAAAPEKKPEEAAQTDNVKLTPQAVANLGLKTQRLALVTKPYWRSLEVPAQIVERPGNCDRLVTAPLSGIVKHIAAVKGDLVHPGDKLITLQIVSEQLFTAQSSLYKTHRELDIVKQEKARLAEAAKSGAISAAKIIEVDNQHDRVVAALDTLRHELLIRGLSSAEVEAVTKGKFLTEITITAPPPVEMPKSLGPIAQVGHTPPTPPLEGGARGGENDRHGYEVEELKVLLGEMVQQGQALIHLADHHLLFIEGRVFEGEAPTIQRAAKEGWPVRAEFIQDPAGAWPSFDEPLKIRSLANKVDPASQTLAFYLAVANQHQEFQQGGKTYRLWRFRPGQRLRIHVPLEPFEDVFVLPAEAVVREGPEAYVFRESGDFFKRTPVHVLFEDRQVAILANDGSVSPGNVIAINRAVQLNWALKAGAGGPAGHHHHEH